MRSYQYQIGLKFTEKKSSQRNCYVKRTILLPDINSVIIDKTLTKLSQYL